MSLPSEIRVLTVRQPWAWAIIHGGKDVENRVRNIAGKYRGPVAIHVAKTEDKNAFALSPNRKALNDSAYPFPGVPWWENYGHIIGVVDLVEVTSPGDIGYPGDASPWAMDDHYHLHLRSPRAITPIPYKGGLGLRRITDPELISQLLNPVSGDAITTTKAKDK